MRRVIAMPGAEALAADIALLAGGRLEAVEARRFPDGEHQVRLMPPAAPCPEAVLVADLSRPDGALLPLLFAAHELRRQGVKRLRLAAPYLPYMRQDRAFRPGEAVSSEAFARLLSAAVDELVTVDPHLHRRASLDEIFTIPSRVVSAAPLLGGWIAAHVERPLVIGPDSESLPWASAAAKAAGAPLVVLDKARLGDRRVRLTVPDLSAHAGCTPVIVDDILSSGGTVIETARALAGQGLAPPVVAVTHLLPAAGALRRVQKVARSVISTGTVPGPTAAIGVAVVLAEALGPGL